MISVQSSEAVIPVGLINPITLDYFKSPGIKNSDLVGYLKFDQKRSVSSAAVLRVRHHQNINYATRINAQTTAAFNPY